MMINPRLNATMSYPRSARNSHQLDFFYLLVGYPDKPSLPTTTGRGSIRFVAVPWQMSTTRILKNLCFQLRLKKTIQKSSFHFLHIFQVFWTLKMEQKLDSKALWSLNPSIFQSPKVRTVPNGLWLQFTSTRDPLRKQAMGGEDQSIECQVKPANNSLTCCYVISKEPCEETLMPFHFILWWSYVGAFFENRNMTENMREVYLQTKFQLVLRQNNTTVCSLLWQLDNFRDSPPSNPQIVSNHFKSSEKPNLEKPNLDLLGCLTQGRSRTFFPSTSSQAFLWSLL